MPLRNPEEIELQYHAASRLDGSRGNICPTTSNDDLADNYTIIENYQVTGTPSLLIYVWLKNNFRKSVLLQVQ